MTEDDIIRVIGRFQRAGLGEASWTDALSELAAVTGSMGGELIGLGAHAAVPFNWMSGLPLEAASEFVAVGAGDPSVNSRVRVGMAAPELAVLDESAFTSAQDARRFPAYGEWLRRYDLSFGCLSPLLRQDGLLVGMALMRTAGQGNVTDGQKAAVAAIAPHVRAAVLVRMAIGHQVLSLAEPLLEALARAVIVCDRHGRILSRSTGADDALTAQSAIVAIKGYISGAREHEDKGLKAAIAAAASEQGLAPPPRPVILRDREGRNPVVVEVTAGPAAYQFRHGSCALLALPHPLRQQARIAELATDLFRLTHREADIAARLASGQGPQSIAGTTGVAIGTIRTHIRRIFEKCEVRSLSELSALLSRL